MGPVNQSSVILSVNSGSSSLKAALYRHNNPADPDADLIARVTATPDRDRFRLWIGDVSGATLLDQPVEAERPPDVLRSLLAAAQEIGLPAPDIVGHRVVHGGPNLTVPTLITPDLVEQLKALLPLAPLHLPAAINLIEAAMRVLPKAPQVACFDTSFHHEMPEVFQYFPLPRSLRDKGIRRYGFHGLSYESVLASLGTAAPGRIVVAHLGSGASLAAVCDGVPVDTTMGLTPTGGLMMGTRSGDLDPGVLVYLMRTQGLGAEEIDQLVNEESGLLGVSEVTADMRGLLRLSETDTSARLAVEMFCLSVRKHIGAMAVSLGGIDQLVFTAAIGENSPKIRSKVCTGLQHLGINIDEEKNSKNERLISAPASPCHVLVVPTDEELMIARHTWALVGGWR